jgi:hypothetical protein
VMDSDRATIARNSSAIDSRLGSIPTQSAASAAGVAGLVALAGTRGAGQAAAGPTLSQPAPRYPPRPRTPPGSPRDPMTGDNP